MQAARTAKEAADARKAIQEELDQLTLTRVELIEREREAVSEGNRALTEAILWVMPWMASTAARVLA